MYTDPKKMAARFAQNMTPADPKSSACEKCNGTGEVAVWGGSIRPSYHPCPKCRPGALTPGL